MIALKRIFGIKQSIEMKNIYILLFGFYISCNGSNSECAKEVPDTFNSSDTTVKCWDIPSNELGIYPEKKYAVVVQQDTSCLLVDVTSINAGVALVINFEVNCHPTFDLKDSSVIELTKSNQSRQKPTYHQQLKELSYLFKFLAQQYALNKITSISFSLSTINGLQEELSTTYRNKYQKDMLYHSSINKRIKALVYQTSLYSDLNNVLKKYALKIDRAEIDELVLVNEVRNKDSNANEFADGILILKVKPI